MKCMMVLIVFTVCVASDVPRLVCYFDRKAQYRQGTGLFNLKDVNSFLCTHLIYAGLSNHEILNYNIEKIKPLIELKKTNPELKIMVSIGGWNSEQHVNNQEIGEGVTINQFSNSVHQFLTNNLGIDGIDLSWPWEPYFPNSKYKTYFVNQLSDLRTRLGHRLISITASGNLSIADDAYSIKKIDGLVDFVNLKTYNLGNSSSAPIDHHSPLRRRKWEKDQVHTPNVDSVVNYWMDKGLTRSKLNMGIPFFGKSWKMGSSSVHPPAIALGPGDPGPITKTAGLLAFYEICRSTRIDTTLKAIRPNDGISGPFAYEERKVGSKWVAYDDPVMVRIKARYIIEKQLGGAVVWDISMDDFRNVCNLGKNPLLTTVCETLKIKSCLESTDRSSRFTSTSGCMNNFRKHWVLVFLPFCLAYLL